MEIIVCLKQVPETQNVVMDQNSYILQRDRVPLILNPADAAALEIAWQLKKQHGGKITAISMGVKKAAAVLAHAAAQGAERTVLVSDPLFAGSDTYATALVLSRAIQRIGAFDLILCGRRAIDGETGQVGAELAVMLGIPCMTNTISISLGEGALTGVSLTQEGLDEVLLNLPALVTICEGSAQEHMPSLLHLRNAKNHCPETFTNRELNLEKVQVGLSGSKTRVRRVYHPPKGVRSCRFAADLTEGVVEIAGMLAEVLK